MPKLARNIEKWVITMSHVNKKLKFFKILNPIDWMLGVKIVNNIEFYEKLAIFTKMSFFSKMGYFTPKRAISLQNGKFSKMGYFYRKMSWSKKWQFLSNNAKEYFKKFRPKLWIVKQLILFYQFYYLIFN